jgi:hypothetical protein
MQSIKFRSLEEAQAAAQRVFDQASQEGLFVSGTTAYAIPEKEEFWTIPVLPGFERFFTPEELSGSERIGRMGSGLQIIDDLMVYLDSELSVEDTAIFLNRISSVIVMLQVGNLPAARTRAETITTTSVYSQTRKTWLIGRIQQP